jgi:methylated-DNA-[protein]-cysteine S-methyltransferase
MTETTRYTRIPSPIGELLLTGSDEGLTGLRMEQHGDAPDTWVRDDAAFANARAQIEEYFAGVRTAFDLPLVTGGSDFQERVWQELRSVGFGETITYAELARRIDRPGAVRAVGLANSRNPLAIVVPDHRVIGSSGSLTGYGGGVERKAWLLVHERTVLDERALKREAVTAGAGAPVGTQRSARRRA